MFALLVRCDMGRTPCLIWHMPTKRVVLLLAFALGWQIPYLTSHIAMIATRTLQLASLSQDDHFLLAVLAVITGQVSCLCREVVTLGSRGLCKAASSRSSSVDSAGAVHVGADILEAAGVHQGEDTWQDD